MMIWPLSTSTSSATSSTTSTTSSTSSTASTRDDATPASTSFSLSLPFFPFSLDIPAFLAGSALTLLAVATVHALRRFPTAEDIPRSLLRRHSLLGVVVRVGDGDNLRIYHTPGGRLAGWAWLRARQQLLREPHRTPTEQTIHVRLAGVDAPENAHFGNPAQPFGPEALAWLRGYCLGRRVRVYLHSKDQFKRVVGTAYVFRDPLGLGIVKRDPGLKMLTRGLATVYEAKTGVEYGGREWLYRRAQDWAVYWKKGIWGGKRKVVTPRQYKDAIKAKEKEKEKEKGNGRK